MNPRAHAQRALALLSLLTAVALLALAWPRLKAAYHYLPVDTAIGNYFATREIPSAQLDGLIDRAHESIGMHDHYRYWEGLSLLHNLRALDEATPYWEKRPELRRALSAIEEVVRRAPATPRVWLRMARIQSWLRAPEPYILAPLKMSILTGRVEPSLLIARLEVGYRYLHKLDAETAALLRDQTVLAWRVMPRGLRSALDEGRVDFERVKSLLAEGRSDILAEMEAQLGHGA